MSGFRRQGSVVLVLLVALLAAGCPSAPPAVLTAAFTADVTSGDAPLSVQFTDSSTPGTSAITSWVWDFGDPVSGDDNTSTAQHPSHRYNAVGSYSVGLTVTTSDGADTATEAGFIVLTAPVDPPVASFTADVTEGAPGLTVQFSDTSVSSTSAITAWLWDFGDATSGAANVSTEQHPAHTYAASGVYTVSLGVTNATASNTMEAEDLVVVVENVALAQSIRRLRENTYNIWDAARLFEEAFFATVAEHGLAKAEAIVDLMLAAELDNESDLANLMRRFDQLAGSMVAVPEAVLPATGKQSDEQQACNGTTIIHINGMNVLYTGFLANVTALTEAIISDPRFQTEDIDVYGIYQRSATDTQQSIFGGIVCPLVGLQYPLLRARLAQICAGGGALIDLAESGQQKIKDWLTLPDFLDNPSAVFDYNLMHNAMINEVRGKERSVIVVSHSQGNFFARDVIGGLGFDDFGNYADAIRVVQVASPASTMPTGTVRIDVCQDPVSLLGTVFPASGCHPWHVNPTGGIDVGAHDFVTSYLAEDPEATARGAMIDAISDFHFGLTNPRAHSDLDVDPIQMDLSPEMPTNLVSLGIKAPDVGDIEWTAETTDPRIDLDVATGRISSGQTPPDSNTIAVSVNDFTQAFIGQVEIRNDCVPDEVVGVQIRVGGDGLATIDFDDVEGSGFVPIEGNRYADMGVVISSNENLVALVGNDDTASGDTSICGLDGRNACAGTISLDFDPPVSTVSFYVGDEERDRSEQFTIEVKDSEGDALDFVVSRIDRAFFTFELDDIAQVILIPSGDFENMDSLSFIR